ncbi:MAG: hypothetical protein K8S55_03405 [Phycisphaerae bacterium]|nr:hypothetical protein [Phycisphaerae bacterium]
MRVLLLVVAVCLFAVGCNDDKARRPVDTSKMDSIAQGILKDIAAGKAKKSYDEYFSLEFRANNTLEEWAEDVAGYRQRLGKLESIKRLSETTLWVGDEVDATFKYEVVWKESPGELVLNVRRTDQWKVVSLRIDPRIIKDVDAETLERIKKLR